MTIYCVGRNYINHAKELNNPIPDSPLVFLASDISLRGFKQAPIAFENETFHYEGEIIVKIAKSHNLNEKITKESISSLALGIDLTRRQEQTALKKKGYPWTTSKSFLGSTIVSEFVPVNNFENLENIDYELWVNGDLKQKANTQNMIFSIETICNHLNTYSPLQEGDLILTGTPEGVGEIVKGDSFEMKFPIIPKSLSGTI